MAEEPKYTILHRREGYEIREYAPAVIAEVVVEGPYRYAMNRGFNLLADYIFGNNRRRDSIPMTKPVTARTPPNGTRRSFMLQSPPYFPTWKGTEP